VIKNIEAVAAIAETKRTADLIAGVSHGPCSVHVLSPSDHFPGGSIPHDLIVFSVHRNSLLLFMT
jgi:hypothetical protein